MLKLHHVGFVVANIETGMAGTTWDGQIYAGPQQNVTVPFLTTRPLPAKCTKPATSFGARRFAWILTAEKALSELLTMGKRP